MAATLKSRLPGIAASLQPRVSAAVKEGAERIREAAQERVRVRTEELHHAIHTEHVGPAAYAVVAGDDDAFYGHMLEFGTAHSPAFPFLVPAVEAEKDTVVDLVHIALGDL